MLSGFGGRKLIIRRRSGKLLELEQLLQSKVEPEVIKQIKKLTNELIDDGLTKPLMELLDEKFMDKSISRYNKHLLSVISNIYSTLSLKKGIEFSEFIIQYSIHVPNFAISDLLRNCRKLQDYSVFDDVLLYKPNILKKTDITILYESVFYYDNKGDLRKV